MRVSQQKNEEKKIILYLYLLHHPDHGYSIAGEFLEASKTGNWSKKRYSDLTNYKVYTTLKQMLSEETIKTKTEPATTESKQKTNKYHPAAEFAIKTEDQKKEDIDFLKIIEALTEYVSKSSPDKQRCIKEISSIKRYDNLTVLCYIKKLLRETAELNALAQPKIGTTEKHPGFGEFDTMRKLSDEIVKAKKIPSLLKPLGAKETCSFFCEALTKKGFPYPPADERTLLELFSETERKIDKYLIDYSYKDRIPAKT
jgi:hypothetical protein